MESLYRKYRPQTFESMVGQKHIVSTLQNALADGRMAHAYLFTGPRGTGKTTTARLLAKALMCEAGGGAATPHPDGTCEQCLEIARGTHPDVYELDAASRTGVDNVRDEIINRVAFAPTQGRYKVYVIDEVHMLTTAAFNALLKTLEEPPSHVVFVLCTTDPQKIPETVLSRCQRLEFHRISDADIAERLEFVCTSEGFEYDGEALALVARHARGGLRDALSTLETLSVHGRGSVRVEDARELLGEVADDTLSGMAELVAARDVAGCFAHVAEMSSRGMDIEQYVRDFTRHMRNVYVAAVAGKDALHDVACADEFVAQAGSFGGADRLAYILDLLGGLEDALRTSTDQRLDFEVALTRMARPKADLSLEALAARVEALEAELAAVKAGGVAVAAAQPSVGTVAAPVDAVAQPNVGAHVPAPASSAARPGADKLPSFARMPQQASPAGVGGVSRGVSQQQPAAQAPFASGGAPSPSAFVPQQASAQPTPVAQGLADSRLAAQPAAASAPQQAMPARPAAQPASALAGQRTVPTPPANASAPKAPDARWGQICQEACALFMPVSALLNKATGHFDADDTLVVVNQGSDFVAKQLQRDNPMNALKKAAEKVMGRAVPIRIEGAGAAARGAHSATQAPMHPAVQMPAQQAVRPVPSFGAAAPARPPVGGTGQAAPAARPGFGAGQQPSGIASQQAASRPGADVLPSFARMPQQPAAQLAFAPAHDAALPAFARMPQAPASASAPARQPAAPMGSQPSVPTPAEEAPAFEFAPDDMYDGYQDASADVPADGYGAPWDEPAPASQPAPAPAPHSTSAPARATAPAGAATTPAPAQASGFQSATASTQPASGEDPTAWLSRLLEAGFGQPVKVTRE